MKTYIHLTPEQILKIARNTEELIFDQDFDLIYERHFLPGVVILLEGELRLTKPGVLKKINNRGILIGWKEIQDNKKSGFKLTIKAGSRILLIGRSGLDELQEILSDDKIEETKIHH